MTRQPPGSCIDRIREVADVWMWPHDSEMDHAELASRIPLVDGLYCMLTDRIDAELLSLASRLRVVSSMAVGVDNIDLSACARLGIRVGHTPDVLTESTADMAFALLMAASRRFEEGMEYVRSGSWTRWEPSMLMGRDVSGTTLGIIGMGRIGRGVARRASGFDMRVVYASRSSASAADESGAKRVPMSDLLTEADHVVVCVPLTPETTGLIGSDELEAMKPTANLVNIARGPIVDSDALHHALTNGVIRCAALDVTDPEPIPADHPLVGLPNCLILPQLGSATERTRVAMADLAADNLIAGLAGERMPAEVAASRL